MAELSDAAIETVTEVADHLEVMTEGARQIGKGFIAFGVIVTSATSAMAGYYVADRRLRLKYEQVAEDEIDQMREHFRARMVVKDTKPDLSDLSKRVQDLQYAKIPPAPPAPGEPNVPPTTYHNVFETVKQGVPVAEPSWDWDAEQALREKYPDVPFAIHYDERHEEDWEEVSVTYYAGDDVLCDGKDKVIDDPDLVVGIPNLERFGEGSNDPTIVYVRNRKLKVDLEVAKSDKTYAEEVHGLKHMETSMRKRHLRDE